MRNNEDRVYVFLKHALHGSDETSSKYFFDCEDNTLFLLKFINGKYQIDERVPRIATEHQIGQLNEKITKVSNQNGSIYEIKRLRNAIHIPSLEKRERTDEEFNRLWHLEQKQFELTNEFINDLGIDPVKAIVIG